MKKPFLQKKYILCLSFTDERKKLNLFWKSQSFLNFHENEHYFLSQNFIYELNTSLTIMLSFFNLILKNHMRIFKNEN